MKDNYTYDYTPTTNNPIKILSIDFLNYIPVYFINNTYDDSWRIVGITELIITSPYY